MNSSLIEKKEIRKFGAIEFIFFGALFALALWFQKLFLTYFFGFLSFFGLAFILLPGPLRIVYHKWLNIAHLIGRVMTIIILSIAYYVVITPSALIKRLIGGRPLPVSPDRNATTYWINRDEPIQPKARFIKRY